ncbi:MAG: hypothetical protein MJZ30_11425 [Paludibacteraceae bacterium]|nr:hypothetical protein [Paludibacteraceae bacterium]
MAKLTKEQNDAAYFRLTKDRRHTALIRIACKIENINKNCGAPIVVQQNECRVFANSMRRLYGITMQDIKAICRSFRVDCRFLYC